MVSRRSLIRAAIFVPERHFDEMLGGPMPHRHSKGHQNVDFAANSAKCLAFDPARFCVLRNDCWANPPTQSRVLFRLQCNSLTSGLIGGGLRRRNPHRPSYGLEPCRLPHGGVLRDFIMATTS